MRAEMPLGEEARESVRSGVSGMPPRGEPAREDVVDLLEPSRAEGDSGPEALKALRGPGWDT